MKTCAIPDCGKRVYSRGWCERHYRRWQRYGDPLFVPIPDDLPPRARRLETALPLQTKLVRACHTEGGKAAAQRYLETTQAMLKQTRARLEQAAQEAER